MSYCDGNCEHLNARKHKCELTGEKLAYMKWSYGIEYSIHEHRGFCEKDEEDQMGYCKLECPDGETECYICCEKQDSCQCRCGDMDGYEYAEKCEDYIKEE